MTSAALKGYENLSFNNHDRLLTTLKNELGFDLAQTNLNEIVTFLEKSGQNFSSYDDFVAAVASRIAVHETYFLRHHDQFAWIETNWLQEILARPPETRQVVRILSAGCSSGEEPYSLFAHLYPLLKTHGIHLEVDAIDVNQNILNIARKGQYGLWSLRGVDSEEETSWLEVRSRDVRVKEWVKSGVNYYQHNLTLPFDSFHIGRYDLVLCRNVMIYMLREAIEKVYGNLFSALKPDGYLVPGPSDPSPVQVPWLLHWGNGIRLYRKTPCNLPASSDTLLSPALPDTPEISISEKSVGDVKTVNEFKPVVARYNHHSYVSIASLIEACRYDDARRCLQENLDNNPVDVRSYVMYSMLAFDLNELKLAQTKLRKALYLRPDAPYVVYLDANVKHQLKDYKAEIKDLQWLKQGLEKFPPYQPVEFCEEMSIEELKGVINARLAAMRKKP